MERGAGSQHAEAKLASADYPSSKAAIVLVDRRALIRELVASFLRERMPEFAIFQADSVEELGGQRDFAFAAFVVFQSSLFTEVGKSFSGLAHLRQAFPTAPLIVVSDFGRYDLVSEAFRCGARGFIPTVTSVAIFEQALRTVLAGGEYVPASVLENSSSGGAERSTPHGGPRFTPRQQEVLGLLREGLPNKMIAFRLDMRESTVKVHLRQIMRKMNATNRTQVVASLTSSEGEAAAGGDVVGCERPNGPHAAARLLQTTTA
jgi:DNA-binding NarL/FixJ family response regulator